MRSTRARQLGMCGFFLVGVATFAMIYSSFAHMTFVTNSHDCEARRLAEEIVNDGAGSQAARLPCDTTDPATRWNLIAIVAALVGLGTIVAGSLIKPVQVCPRCAQSSPVAARICGFCGQSFETGAQTADH